MSLEYEPSSVQGGDGLGGDGLHQTSSAQPGHEQQSPTQPQGQGQQSPAHPPGQEPATGVEAQGPVESMVKRQNGQSRPAELVQPSPAQPSQLQEHLGAIEIPQEHGSGAVQQHDEAFEAPIAPTSAESTPMAPTSAKSAQREHLQPAPAQSLQVFHCYLR